MKKFSIYHIPLYAFFSTKLYRDIAFQWKGICFGYLFLLLLICWLPTIIRMQTGISNFIDNEAPAFTSQIPDITIKDGKVSIDKPQPYKITTNTGKNIFVIDTTGKINSLEEADSPGLITEDKLIYRQSKYETRTLDFADIEDFTLDKENIHWWMGLVKKYLILAISPFCIIGSYIYRIIQALIYALVGLLFAKFCKSKIPYSALIRLSIAAVTPVIIISSILDFAGTAIPFAWFWYMSVTLGLLFFAVHSASEKNDETENEKEPEHMIY